jgi:hypothetical protein
LIGVEAPHLEISETAAFHVLALLARDPWSLDVSNHQALLLGSSGTLVSFPSCPCRLFPISFHQRLSARGCASTCIHTHTHTHTHTHIHTRTHAHKLTSTHTRIYRGLPRCRHATQDILFRGAVILLNASTKKNQKKYRNKQPNLLLHNLIDENCVRTGMQFPHSFSPFFPPPLTHSFSVQSVETR